MSKQQYSAACLTYLRCVTNANVSNPTSLSVTPSLNDVIDSGYDSLPSDSSFTTCNSDVQRTATGTKNVSTDCNRSVSSWSPSAMKLCEVKDLNFVERRALLKNEYLALFDERSAVTSPVDYYHAFARLLTGLQSVHSASAFA